MLIHMSPREVQGLQALAMAHGGSLTVNPETGLPEAGFLDKLLPTILGAGLTFMGVPPNVSAMIVGGIQTVRTGDLGKGIQAGLGAYGGANLTSSMTAAGSSALGADANLLAAQQATELSGLESMSSAFGGAGATAGADAVGQVATNAVENATPFEKLSRGFGSTVDQFKNNPMQALKTNAKDLGYAFGPAILAGANVQNKLPQTVTKPGMISPYTFDPYSGTYTAANPYQATPTRAAGGGLMGFDDGGYNPGQLDFTQRSEPVVRMAEGGIAHFANGGDAALAAYQAGNYGEASRLLAEAGMSAQDVVSKYGLSQADAATVAQNLGYTGDMSGIQYAAPPPVVQAAAPVVQAAEAPVVQAAAAPVVQAATAAPTYTQYTNEQIGSYLAANPTADITAATKATNADPAAVNAYIASLTSPFVGSTLDTRGSGTLGIYNQMLAQGVDPDEYYKAALADDPKYAGWSLADIKRGYKLDEGAYALSKKLSGNVSDKDWVKFMDEGGYSVNDMAQAFGLSTREVQARYDAAKTKTTTPIICPTGYKLNAAGTACELIRIVETFNPPITNVTTPTNISTAVSTALPPGVSGAGITTINPNGTITTRPDLTLGMGEVRDDYVRGGGSLGYTSPTFASLKAVEDKYPLRGGSKQSYDYLTGKTDYDPVPYTKTGELMKPYSSSVLGIPMASSKRMYLFDPATKQYKINPDYAIPTYDKDGKKSYNLTNADVTAFMDKKPSTDAFYTWATTNNLSPEQIAQASGRSINEISRLFTGAKDLVGEDGKIDQTKLDEKTAADEKTNFDADAYLKANPDVQAELDAGKANFGTKDDPAAAAYEHYLKYGKAGGRKYTKKAAGGGLMNMAMARGGMAQQFNLGDYSDGGRLLRGPGDGVSDSIPASIGGKRPARLADGEFVVPARIVSELGNGSTEAGARKLYAMMDRIQKARRGTVGRGRVAKNSRSEKYLPA
jgi:hypothetical protein